MKVIKEIVELAEKKTDKGGSTYYQIKKTWYVDPNETEEKPLFGKLVGTYWWDPMIRGNKSEGLRVKDYEVKA